MKCLGCGKEVKSNNKQSCKGCSRRKNYYKNLPDEMIFNFRTKRSCQDCGKEIFYKDSFSALKAEINNSRCNRCAAIKANCGHHERTEETRKKLRIMNLGRKHSDEINAKKSSKGHNNPMYGRSVYDVWLEKYGKEEADKRNNEFREKQKQNQTEIQRRPEMRKRTSERMSGSNNPMYGRSVYDVWLEKYGKEEADKRLNKFKETQSKNSKSNKNPMYGRPSPQGSGNGWSGWYKSFYFRSLLELSYLKHLVDNNIKFKSAETKDFRIKYVDYKNSERNYFPDYYLEDTKEIIEVKPKNLINSKDNKDKFEAAKKQYGKKFKIITEHEIEKLSFEEIKILYETKELKFLDRYEQKFKDKYLCNK